MKHRLLLMVAGMFLSIVSFGQTATGSSHQSKEKTLEEKMEGTYMIINKSKKVTPVFTTDILTEIEKRRDASTEIYWEYNENVTIKILSKAVINAPDFDPKKFY
jgi:hypothetical protein